MNYDLFCFWSSLQKRSEDFISEIIKIKDNEKNGKELYLKLKKASYEDIFNRGIRFYILNRISYSGTVDSGGYSQEAFEKRFTYSKIYQLYSISKILDNVIITSEDYSNLLYDNGDDVFIYLDPPYLSTVESKLYGKNGNLHKSFNHHEFAEKMKNCNFKWLITLDDTNEMRRIFNFASINPLNVVYGMDNFNGRKTKNGRELLISNYKPKIEDDIKVYKNIFKEFIKKKYNRALIEINLPLNTVKENLKIIKKDNELYQDLDIYIKNKKLYIKRKNEIPTITL